MIPSREALEAALADPGGCLLILHHGTQWDYGKFLFREAPARRKLLRYHNVTLSESFLDYPFGYLESTISGRFETMDLIPHADRIAAPSHWAISDLFASGADPDRLEFLPFLHDLNAFDATESDESLVATMSVQPGLRLLLLGRQVPSKGLHHALATLKAYRDRCDLPLHLWIVGSRDSLLEAYFRDLSDFLEAENLGDRVTFLPEVDRQGVVTLMRTCDVLVTMSESDAAPIPLLEAAWLGKPITGVNRGGKAELAGPGQLLFDTFDPHLHAEAWASLASNASLRCELGDLARSHVLRQFHPETVRAKFVDLFRELTDRPPIPRPREGSDPGA